ncbi:MAG TPA: NAC family transcription factor [Methanospirillum sp.]|uniref:NAC family transcription factor n=1 Tax=Methanospirillum sp. TaxID=45200 RepID=UPI002BA862BF|nr:NAC family transcription factor [Methanospirillum sp.]HWQ64792.1 NAC family transcription factor [Methanospirillum sp.]
MTDDKDGVYCKVCGGIIPKNTTIGSIVVDGKATGINQLDYILNEVAALQMHSENEIKQELITRAKNLNYIPTKITEKYEVALFNEYIKRYQ